MVDLVLRPAEQAALAALAALVAAEPVPGDPIPPREAFEALLTLVPADALETALADDQGRGCLDRRHRPFSERDLAMLRLVAPLLPRLLRERPTPHLPASVTVQERRVLMHVATGASNAEIARAMFIAPSTVRKHLEHVYAKLGVHSRLQALAVLRGSDVADLDLRERVTGFA